MRETLPTLALRLGARLDLLRKIVRTSPALKALGEFDDKAEPLRALARYIVERKS